MNFSRKAVFLLYVLVSTFFYQIDLSGENKICLTMIVKNESKIIERCMDSVKDIVDSISICDTGSTDDTVQIIEDYLQKNNIPGKVHHHEWENFGHNRTLSVQAAQEWLSDVGEKLEETFLLLLDADMMLVITPHFTKTSLTADGYLMAQRNHSYNYYNTRLVRASLPWHCVGVTHEYWACKAFSRESRLETLTIDDRDDGGSKSDKFERDVRMLTKGIEEEPNNSRYVFYLATSYHCLSQYEEAIKWYENYIAMGGWFEEVWYAKYMIGTCYESLGKWDQALAWYLNAFQSNSYRAEPLHQISKYYRMNGLYDLSYFFAKKGAQIPYPYNQSLFISFPVYDYLFDEELSISAYYTSYKDDGFDAVNRLMLKKNIPYYIRDQAYHNVLYYVKYLENAHYFPINVELPYVRDEFGVRYNPMNPSILKTEEGFDVICRTVNYLQIGAKHYQTLDLLDPTNTIRTKNIFVRYDKEFNLVSQQEVTEDLPRNHYKFMNVEGLEDCRLFDFDGSSWFTCTTLDTSPGYQPQISLCKLSDDRSGKTAKVESLMPLMGPNPSRCEKNWLPFVKDGEFHVIYSYDPLVIFKPAIGQVYSQVDDDVLVKNVVQEHDFSRFSGSAPPIAFDDGYLLLVHESLYEDGRIYLHRYVYMGIDFNITEVSKPFIFFHKGVEYCCGMAIDHSGENLVMTIGLEDREAYLVKVDLETVRSMLEPL